MSGPRKLPPVDLTVRAPDAAAPPPPPPPYRRPDFGSALRPVLDTTTFVICEHYSMESMEGPFERGFESGYAPRCPQPRPRVRMSIDLRCSNIEGAQKLAEALAAISTETPEGIIAEDLAKAIRDLIRQVSP